MSYKYFSSILLLFAALVVAGCNSAESSKKAAAPRPAGAQIDTAYADGVNRMTIEELEQLRTSGKVLIVDVRNQAAFDQGHIPGAKLIPVNEVLARINEFPRDKQIVTYCS